MRLREFFLFTSPTLATGAVMLYFIYWNAFLSFTDYSPLNPSSSFVGLSTYGHVFSDPDFISSLERTMAWVALLVLLGNLFGLLIASAIFNLGGQRLRNVFTAYFIYPLSLSLVTSGIVWRWLFDNDRGLNALLRPLGLPGLLWLSGINAFWSLVLVSVWVYSGLGALFYLAMFYNVSREIIESAQVDGAGTLKIMARIVIPNSRQAFIISTIFYTLFSIQMFDLPYSILFINPFTSTMVMYTYLKFAATYFAVAAASAMSIVIISAAIVIPYALYGLKRWIVRG